MSLQKGIDNLYVPEPNSGCWLWIGCTDRNGYGLKFSNGKSRKAHRVMYELHSGYPLSINEHIDHLCRVRCCVNPLHMEVVNNRENVLRGVGITAINAKKTHCKYGHPLSGDNLGIKKLGRFCIACNTIRNQRKTVKSLSFHGA